MMGLFKGKPGDHGKMDDKAAAKARAHEKNKAIARARPSGEAARRLIKHDIDNFKGKK